MIKLVKVVNAKALDGNRLWLEFSDRTEGETDLSEFIASGGVMVEPLRDPDFFKRVFVESGVPTWPNGFDLDAINLYMELEKAGLLTERKREFETTEDEARAALREYE